MARTYKKRSKKMSKKMSKKSHKKMPKKMPKKMSKKMHRHRRKNTAGVLEDVPFGYNRFYPDDTCNLCLEKLGTGDNVTRICCGHHLHTECLNSYKTFNKTECPTCRRKDCPEFQVNNAVVNNHELIRELVVRHATDLPTELATSENIERLINYGLITFIDRNQVMSAERINNILTSINRRITDEWRLIQERLIFINTDIRTATGELKTRIDKDTIRRIIQRGHLRIIRSSSEVLRLYNILIPEETNRQIEEINNFLDQQSRYL